MQPSSSTTPPNQTDVNPDWEYLNKQLQITKMPHDIVDMDIIGKSLPSVNAWKSFYYTYAKWMGFSVRKENVRRDADNQEWQRLWVCYKEGFRRLKWFQLINRKRDAKAITRCGCKAHLKVSLDRGTKAWVATTFLHLHNHDLASPSEIQFLRSNRSVPEPMLAQAKSMRMAGIKTRCILDYIAQECGGKHRLPFLKKDLQNKLGADRRDVGVETDCEGALGYLTCLAIRDGNFFCRFATDAENRLDTIIWADGVSRTDYATFGDILAFDTTYRTNAYNKPLLIMVGVNHHWRTTVFATALLLDETTSTFIWVLQQFLECMNNKHPVVVLTDGDHAMRSAIKECLPQSIHRLCAWHVSTNAGNNVPSGEFKLRFNKLLYDYYTEPEFEQGWAALMQDFQLHNSEWARSMYEKRKSWAETFLRGNFFGGMRTTQRCESMNSYMQRFLDSKQLMRDFITQIDKGIQNIRFTEMEDDFRSKHTLPHIHPLLGLRPYHEQVSTTFTRKVYDLVAKELMTQDSYSVTGDEYDPDGRLFRLSKFGFGDIRHEVRQHKPQNHFNCTCLLYETDGIPCRHIFVVLKYLSIPKIPDSLMNPRWQKDAKSILNRVLPSNITAQQDVSDITRLGSINSDFNGMAYYACMYEDTYNEAKVEIARLSCKFKGLWQERGKGQRGTSTGFNEELGAKHNIIKNPHVVKTKGRERENQKKTHQRQNPYHTEKIKKRCRSCNGLGHNSATCKNRHGNVDPVKPMESSLPTVNSDSYKPSQLSESTDYYYGQSSSLTKKINTPSAHDVPYYPQVQHETTNFFDGAGTSTNFGNFSYQQHDHASIPWFRDNNQ